MFNVQYITCICKEPLLGVLYLLLLRFGNYKELKINFRSMPYDSDYRLKLLADSNYMEVI